ncbi:MAG: hotdog fold thioesterase [Alphaproteobacteria bacterium]|nr:hotdog fold thioesterase [Alphaproteobacteria bacterium]
MSEPTSDTVSEIDGHLVTDVPHAAAIGMRVISAGDGDAVCFVPYDPRFVGNPETGVVHGGLVTTLLDNTCGIAVTSKTGLHGQIATLDLRIDYMKPADAGKSILARAECFKVTRNIAFVRGIAYQSDPTDPVATCAATFMIGAKSGKGSNLTPAETA